MTDQQLDTLARIASDTAMRAAADYVRVHGLAVPDYETASQVLRAEVKLVIGPALDDAKQAFAAGMGHVAECTFKAAMVAAGFKAAKEFATQKEAA